MCGWLRAVLANNGNEGHQSATLESPAGSLVLNRTGYRPSPGEGGTRTASIGIDTKDIDIICLALCQLDKIL